MIYQVTTAPTVEPLLLSDFAGEIQVTSTSEAAAVRKIKAAREIVERELGFALITQTVEAWFSGYKAYSPVSLPVQPVQSITSVHTYDEDGTATTVSSSNYRLSASEGGLTYVLGGSLYAKGGGWSQGRGDNGLRVVYVAGFGDAGADVPSDILEAVYRVALYLWKNREDQVTGTVATKAIKTASDLLFPWRRVVV